MRGKTVFGVLLFGLDTPRTIIASALVALLVLTGCSGEPQATGQREAQSLGAKSESGAPAVRLASPSPAPVVIGAGQDAAGPAVKTSQALFAASPVAVIAVPPAGKEKAGQPNPGNTLEQARQAAVELGVPIFLAGQRGVGQELKRLGVQSVLTFGSQDDGGWQPDGPLDVLDGQDDIDQLPDFESATAKAPAVVLSTGAKNPQTSAALATAQAAGAAMERVEKTDPRASSHIIELLKEHRGKPVLAIGGGFAGRSTFAQRIEAARNSPQLPGGGQLAFPGRRMVALYGHPGTSTLGALGEQGIHAAVERAENLAAQYQPYSEEPVIPAFEIIATIATAAAGPDGDYSKESSVEELKPWVDAASKAGGYVVLDLQPGRTDFLTQAKRYEELLKRPNVGLALDPEWRLGPGQQHMMQIGSVDASEVNQVSAWLAELTRKNDLPQKAFLLHQFSPHMVTNRDQLNLGHDELATVIHADGHGVPGSKQQTYAQLQHGLDPRTWMGWKNFIDEDTPTFTPERTYTQVNPKPWFVSYQ